MEGPAGESWVSDAHDVESLLHDMRKQAEEWEADLAEAEAVTFVVDTGDIHAVANADGKLVGLTLSPSVMRDYSHGELADRLNVIFAALREEAEEDYRTRYGGGVR